MVSIQEVMHVIDSFNPEARERLMGIEIQISPDATRVGPDGTWVRAQYFNADKQILIYGSLIRDADDLREVILHEIGHFLNLSHKDIRH